MHEAEQQDALPLPGRRLGLALRRNLHDLCAIIPCSTSSSRSSSVTVEGRKSPWIHPVGSVRCFRAGAAAFPLFFFASSLLVCPLVMPEAAGPRRGRKRRKLGCAGEGERSGASKGKRSGERNEKTLAAGV